jgi:hypothetical protein
MEKASKAEAKLKAMCDGIGITPEGRKWLDVCLDPFKDIEQKPVGYPDKQMARSCVQTIHDTITITAPASAAGGNWDCHIFSDVLWTGVDLYDTPPTGSFYFRNGQGATPHKRGGVVVRSGPAGLALTMTSTQNAQCLSFKQDVFAGNTPSRMLATGFEVHDTTQELKKQGAVVVYRISDDATPASYTVAESNAVTTNCQSGVRMVLPEPPTSAGQAIDIPLSQEWESKLGCYVVPVLNTTENPPVDLTDICPNSVDVSNTPLYEWFPKIQSVGTIRYISDKTATIPFGLSGAYFTGLDNAATLVLNVAYYVEQFPDYQSALHRLTHASCPQDNMALEFYTKIARVMPVGVPVNDNFLGAFISGIANIARTVLPRLVQGARVVSTVANVVAPLLNSKNSERSIVGNTGAWNPEQIRNHERQIVERDQQNVARQAINNERAIVPYRPILEVLSPEQRREVIREVRQTQPIRQNVRNRRKKDYNRTEELVKRATMPNAGNKWLGK